MELLAWTAILVYIAARDDGWWGRIAMWCGVLFATYAHGAVAPYNDTIALVLAAALMASTVVSIFARRGK